MVFNYIFDKLIAKLTSKVTFNNPYIGHSGFIDYDTSIHYFYDSYIDAVT